MTQKSQQSSHLPRLNPNREHEHSGSVSGQSGGDVRLSVGARIVVVVDFNVVVVVVDLTVEGSVVVEDLVVVEVDETVGVVVVEVDVDVEVVEVVVVDVDVVGGGVVSGGVFKSKLHNGVSLHGWALLPPPDEGGVVSIKMFLVSVELELPAVSFAVALNVKLPSDGKV